ARWPLTGGGARRNGWRHVAAAIAAPAVHTLLVFTPTALLRGWTAEGTPAWMSFQFVFVNAAAADVAHFALLVAGCHAVIAARGARERELRAARLEARLAEAELHALRSQLEPHFLFNTLNAVAASLRDDPDAAETMLERLGGLLRLVLQGRGRQEVTLASEIDFVRRYLDLHQARFGSRLRVTWSVDPALERAWVPALLLQPLAENAVRHGVSARGAGWIEVAAERDGPRLRLTVRDDGVGPSAAAADGVGLANTRARLAQLYGAEQALAVVPRQPAGTEVEVVLPLRFAVGG
ncbi:MAG TPA: histidine kinase, partial [Longimicrobium sp.]